MPWVVARAGGVRECGAYAWLPGWVGAAMRGIRSGVPLGVAGDRGDGVVQDFVVVGQHGGRQVQGVVVVQFTARAAEDGEQAQLVADLGQQQMVVLANQVTRGNHVSDDVVLHWRISESSAHGMCAEGVGRFEDRT